MNPRELKGLLCIWVNVDADSRVEYQKFVNCEHMPARLKVPGMGIGLRYRGIGKAPNFWVMYETKDVDVMKSKAYLQSVDTPTPKSSEMVPNLIRPVRGIYELLGTSGKRPLMEAPYLLCLQFNVESGSEGEVLSWYKEEVLPRMSRVQGVHRGRLYEQDSDISNLPTGERKIHGGGPSQQKYLAVFDLHAVSLPNSKAWHEAMEADPRSKTMLGKLANQNQDVFWLDFVLYGPEMCR